MLSAVNLGSMEFRTQYLLLSHLKYTYKEKKISKNNPLILATNPNHPVRTSELHVNQIQINCGPKLNTIRHKLLCLLHTAEPVAKNCNS